MKTLMAIVFAIAGAFGAVAAKGAAQTLAAAAIGFAPLVLTIRGRMAAQAQSAQLLAAAREAVGVSADAKFAHMEGGTVIVLNPKIRRMALSAGGESKVYGYDDVRGWSARKESRGGGAVGFGAAGTIAAGSENIAASMRADLNTGLFLTVRDIDHPQWRISMFEQRDRARWEEVLRQELSDGAATA